MSERNQLSTRHLVDPELVAVADAYVPFGLTAETLGPVRNRLAERMAAASNGSVLYPDVARIEHIIPGFDGAPPVRVLAYRSRSTQGLHPALVWGHGGGMVLGSADDDDATCRMIASATGLVVFCVDYRLAPETPAPGAMHDFYATLMWINDHAEELAVIPQRVAVGGSSAGAGIAASTAIFARDCGEISLAFQMLVFPMLDDRTSVRADISPYLGEFVWTVADNLFGWSAYLGSMPGAAGVSPYAAAARAESLAGLPPAYLCVGSLDLFAEEDIDYASRLVRAGVPTELHLYPGGFHGYMMVADSRLAKAHFRDFLSALERFAID